MFTKENKFAEFLDLVEISYEKQAKFGTKKVDYWIPEFKMAIEFNGLYWHSSDRQPRQHLKQRVELLAEYGTTILNIFEDELRADSWPVSFLHCLKAGIGGELMLKSSWTCPDYLSLTIQSWEQNVGVIHYTPNRIIKIEIN